MTAYSVCNQSPEVLNQALLTEVGKWSDGAYQANMLDGNEAKQIYFDRSMNWQYTEWPV